MVNINKLKGKIVENGLSIVEVAARMGIDRTTLYRKISSENFTIGDVAKIKEILKLSNEDINNIFFNNVVT